MDSLDEIIKRLQNSNKLTIETTSLSDKDRSRPCEKCNGVGYVVPDVPPTDQRFGRAIPCVCKHEEFSERKIDNLVQMSQLGELRNLTFKSFMPEGVGLPADKANNLKKAFLMVKQFAEKPSGWLILKGGYGSGKTHLAAAVANDLIDRNQQVLFVNAPDLLDHLRATFRPNATIPYDELFDQVRSIPLLIIDDLGAHAPSQWAQEKLYQIINYRYTAKLPTIITTNEDIEELEPRVRSRLGDTSVVHQITMLVPDFRRGSVYDETELSSLDMHSDKQFSNFDYRKHELTSKEVSNLRRAHEMMLTYADDPYGWVVLNSTSYGCGKTHLAAAAANELTRQGKSVLFVLVPDLLDHLRATFDPRTGARLDKRFAQVKNAPILILDDLGTESMTAWAKEKLFQLFNYRYNANLPTIVTTAVAFDDIDPRLAARFMDKRRCTLFLLEAPTYRGSAEDKRSRRR